ncbi:acyl-CoA synthetase [Uliginosibacterium sp. 31-16]|uniref:LpxL/LpxP family acyltransferase n=1 Tax=Uliginosibacterium sp. 31-16 TaxID=3068315 RepID=UPI00273FFAC2|nr:acyl-CoA synthetase [Uliginosibacterium sp. 31-16]MDP5239239.1 acyl-CoA synthetase [Uliginosibacterium sp. 31-16]
MNMPAGKPAATAQKPEWMQREERGSMFLLRVMSRLSLLLGRRFSRLIVYGIALYFLFAVPAARRASRDYLDRVLGRPCNWFDGYRHILSFASTIHDRFYLLNDRSEAFSVRWFGAEAMHARHDCGTGLFLFGAHLGSFEMLRTLARGNPHRNVCMAMYADNARQINSTLAAINPRAMQDIIPLGQLDSMLNAHNKLQEGAMVGILADRATGTDAYQTVSFLGAPAHFPSGPFRMAAMLRQPVFFMAGLYLGGNRYDVHFEQIADFSEIDRGERDAAIRAAVEKYVATLERHCRAQPYNWFNFYDFWKSARDAS